MTRVFFAKSRISLKDKSWVAIIEDYAKDGGEELFTKMHCARITNPFNDSIGVRLKMVKSSLPPSLA